VQRGRPAIWRFFFFAKGRQKLSWFLLDEENKKDMEWLDFF
jgi:hypothetical protein